MKNVLKRLLIALMTASMVMSMMSLTALADEPSAEEPAVEEPAEGTKENPITTPIKSNDY